VGWLIAVLQRLVRRLESVLWQDLHPLHAANVSSLLQCFAFLVIVLGTAAILWLFLA